MTGPVLKWIGIFLACFILQTTIVPAIALFGIRPDLLLVALFFLAYKTGPLPAIWVGFFLGLGQDLYAPAVLGQNALSKTCAGFFAGLFNERVMRMDIIFQLLLVILTILINDVVFLFVQFMKTGTALSGIVHELFTGSLPRALYSVVFALLPSMREIWSNPFRR